MVLLRISLFGKFRVCRDERPVPGIDAGKVQQLFSYLLLHRDRPHAREKLASLFWDSTTTAQSKKHLRQTLWQLQSSLDEAHSAQVIHVEPEWVQVNTTDDFWLDVALFEQTFLLAQGTAGRELSADDAQKLRQATQLYQGNLLEGWYHDWCLYERERFLHMYLGMLDKLMGYSEARRAYEDGIRYGQMILRYDLARERTHRRLIRLFYQAGNRTEALRQFDRCEAALSRELGVRPARGTLVLNEQIRADTLAADDPILMVLADDEDGLNAGINPEPTGLPEAISRLRQMRATLTLLQQQVDSCLEACRQALHE
ncbi:MAG: hypothetical protein KC418_06515 [Anaerolineales bacterium]|nr:hypothetical protein [Anaerolineales bacterium]